MGDERGEAGVSYETVLILSFIPTRISEPETEKERYRQRRDGCAGTRCCCCFYCCCCWCNWLHATSSVMKRAGCAIRSVNASRKKRLSPRSRCEIAVCSPPVVLFRRLQDSHDEFMVRRFCFGRALGRLELVRDSLGAACFNTASSNIYGTGRSGIAE